MRARSPVRALPCALSIGGAFDTAGGLALDNVARWDGVSYAGLGPGLDQPVEDFAA